MPCPLNLKKVKKSKITESDKPDKKGKRGKKGKGTDSRDQVKNDDVTGLAKAIFDYY